MGRRHFAFPPAFRLSLVSNRPPVVDRCVWRRVKAIAWRPAGGPR